MSSDNGAGSEETVVEVEFEVSDPAYPLVALSAETGGTAELVHLLPRSDDAYTVYQRVTGTPPERILAFARDYDGLDARIVSATEESAIVEFRISGDEQFFVVSLTDAGAIPTELASANGIARLVVEIPAIYSATEVIAQFQETYPSMEIIARRQKEYPLPFFQWQALHETVTGVLTSRQHEVLMHAYARGFYDWPRDTTGEELAAELDVAAATFHEHLRSAEQKLLSLLFDA